jgi:hypothetical protein
VIYQRADLECISGAGLQLSIRRLVSGEHGPVVYAQNIASGGGQTNGAADSSLDRSYQYDDQGRLIVSHSGAEARAHVLGDPVQYPWGILDGPYSLGFDYDKWEI